jgi:hypothetical protein
MFAPVTVHGSKQLFDVRLASGHSSALSSVADSGVNQVDQQASQDGKDQQGGRKGHDGQEPRGQAV